MSACQEGACEATFKIRRKWSKDVWLVSFLWVIKCSKTSFPPPAPKTNFSGSFFILELYTLCNTFLDFRNGFTDRQWVMLSDCFASVILVWLKICKALKMQVFLSFNMPTWKRWTFFFFEGLWNYLLSTENVRTHFYTFLFVSNFIQCFYFTTCERAICNSLVLSSTKQ